MNLRAWAMALAAGLWLVCSVGAFAAESAQTGKKGTAAKKPAIAKAEKPRQTKDAAPAKAAAAPTAWTESEAPALTPVPQQGGFYDKWIRGHLEVGTRFSVISLTNPNRWDPATGGFVGTISHLDEEVNYLPYNLTAIYLFNPHVGVRLAWEMMEAEAVTRTEDRHVDGTYKALGPSLSVVGRLRLAKGVKGYAEIGANFPMAEFEAADWWQLGYPSPADYSGNGVAYHGHRRHLDTEAENPVCLTAGAGLLCKLSRHWMLDVNLRYVDVNAISHHWSTDNGDLNDHGNFEIPLAYLAFGAGVAYRF